MTKEEMEYLLSLLRTMKADILSYKALGVKVPGDEEKTLSRIEDKIEYLIASS